MNGFHLWTVGAALGLGLAVGACDRPPNTPEKPRTEAPADTAPAATPGSGSAAAPGSAAALPVAGAERAFVAEAAQSGMAEVEASRVVAERAADAAVKSYAQQLEREHTSANGELQRIAGDKGITLPTAVDTAAKEQLDRLRGQSAPQLERSFVQDFGVDAHARAIQLFERQAREGQDPDLRSFAERTLPRLREHLAMAQQLQARKPAGG